MSFGKRLMEARKKKRLTQKDVANILGIDNTTISKYENDASEPDNDTTKKLSALYGVNVEWLLYGNDFISKVKQGQGVTEQSSGYLTDEKIDEIITLFEGMNDEDKDYLLTIARRFLKK